MKFRILTLFPEMFESFMNTSIIGRAVEKGKIIVECENIRDYSTNKHKKVDDYPFGGGAGMVMGIQPLKDALLAGEQSAKHLTVYLSPRGQTLTQEKAHALAQYQSLTLICGHYEGIDQRFIDHYVDEEISIGDYILTGGELGAMVLVDTVSRLLDDVLQNDLSAEEESFTQFLLEYDQYTRPAVFEGLEVPPVLLSGNHKVIEEWRLENAILTTSKKRPDLLKKYLALPHDKKTLKIIEKALKKTNENDTI